MKARVMFFATCCVWAGLAGSANAGNRALIVGIGAAYPGLNKLPPVEPDIRVAKEWATLMGFSTEDTHVLSDEKATRVAIIAGLKWVGDGVRGGGTAFIYFSGHGSQLADTDGDEADGCDEAWVPVDFRAAGLISDDQIGKILKSYGTLARVVLVSDSCFSGTIARGVANAPQTFAKFIPKSGGQCNNPVNRGLASPGVSRARAGTLIKTSLSTGPEVVLSAAGSDEVARCSVEGSYFTRAAGEALHTRGGNITFRQLREFGAERIESFRHEFKSTPQLEGDVALFDRSVGGVALQPLAAPPQQVPEEAAATGSQELLDRWVRRSTFAVNINADRKAYRIGDLIQFTVNSTADGYLNILELEPDGNLHLLFPNKYKKDNRITAGRDMQIPHDIGEFKLRAQEPSGTSQVVALVTLKPLHLERAGKKNREDHGLWLLKDTESMWTAARSTGVEAPGKPEREYGANRLYYEVVR